MGKHKFKQLLKNEKNPILADRKILYPIIILDIIVVILNIMIMVRTKISIDQLIDYKYESILIIIGIALAFEIPAVIIDLMTDAKIAKMYKKYKKQEDYKDCCKRIKKPIIIVSLILAIFGIIMLLDLSYCEYTANRPILSIKVDSEDYYEKYRTFTFDFYKCNDGRKYIQLIGTKFEDPYKINVGEETILLKRMEIEKDKVYIGIPTNFTKSSQEHINNRYTASSLGTGKLECYQNEDGKINFVISKTEDDLENENVEELLDYLTYFFDQTIGDYITWGDVLIQTIGEDKKVGILEFNANIPNVNYGNYYCYMWFYPVNGKLVVNSFDVDVAYEKDWKGVGAQIEDSLEFMY